MKTGHHDASCLVHEEIKFGCGSEFYLRASSELVVVYDDEIKQEEHGRAGKQRVWEYSVMKQKVFLQ